MATEIERSLVLLPRTPLAGRVYGLGSVFGKTLRDSRLAMLVVGGLIGIMVFAGGGTMASTYATREARVELAMLSSTMPPVLRGLYGNPLNVDTLGGFIAWHYGAYFALLVGLWSILALSSTLAGEARRGSLEFALATQLSRRWVAAEKVLAHLAAVAIAMAVIAILTWMAGVAFARMPGDAIAPDAAIGFAVGLGVKGLIAGAIAFALAPFFGRGAAAGLAAALMVAGYVLNSYRSVVPAFDVPSRALWFSWTADHLPLAGQADWAAIALTAGVTVVLIAVGIESFARRDVGISNAVRMPWFPRALLGIRGPVGRAFGELLPTSIAWGLGLALYAFVMAASSRSFVDSLAATPEFAAAVRNMVPGIDMTTSAGFLEMAFVDFGLLLAGLAAATFVAGRSTHETAGRLELLLATPLTRARWSIASAAGVGLAVVLAMGVLASGIGLGIVASGADPVQPVVGTLALALYAAALAGIGVAVGDSTRPSFAAPAVMVVAVGTFLLDVLAPALRLPDWVHDLALSAHLGKPIVGTWDWPGMAVCLALALGGVIVGAWGIRRRDVGG